MVPLIQQSGDAMRSEIDLMTQMGVVSEVILVEPDGRGVKSSMQWLNVCDGDRMYKVLIDNQASLHVFKNEALVPNIRQT